MSSNPDSVEALARISSQLSRLAEQVNILAAQALPKAPAQASGHGHHHHGVDATPAHGKLTRASSDPDVPPSASTAHTIAYISEYQPFLQRGIVVEASSDDDGRVLRPALYPDSHKPAPRLDGLERLAWDRTDVMDALKLDSFEGFYNLAMLILGFAMAYLIVRNFKEKGVQLSLDDFTCPQLQRDVASAGVIILAAYAWSFTLLAPVRLWIDHRITWSRLVHMYLIIQCVNIVGVVVYAYASPMAPLPTAAVLMVALVLALKMHSYVATNFAMYKEHVAQYGRLLTSAEVAVEDAMRTATAAAPAPASTSAQRGAARRRKRRAAAGTHGPTAPSTPTHARASENDADVDGDGDASGGEEEVPTAPVTLLTGQTTAHNRDVDIISGSHAQKRRLIRAWPHNVGLADYAFFLAVPSLVYEPKYPRTTRIRWAYVALKCGEMVMCAGIQYAIFKQFLLPVLQNPTKPHAHGMLYDLAALLFDVMKLAIPSLCVWMAMFYMLFHAWMNTLAEVLRFADRAFYGAWWNSTNITAFWKTWNLPVHEWCLRHIFLELQHYLGVNKNVAVFATFFFSAVFHELIFSVSFKTLRPWFFIGMLVQVPLMVIGRRFTNRRRGNYIVWLSLFCGQPLLELLYFREYFVTHTQFFCAD